MLVLLQNSKKLQIFIFLRNIERFSLLYYLNKYKFLLIIYIPPIYHYFWKRQQKKGKI